ncbi:GNAT family N-acetyltransferase [Trinickia fusca]|uniref:N-acetyltransferase n=1 Tax=Trinickia fusca TaxID=2419777 RepID=A0A494XCQ2_9BURK|nr:GNAT family N-acetyltransferase [Trinickia fusca]RKP47421.1 N-acetyltransferase [Trinickia fusca]
MHFANPRLTRRAIAPSDEDFLLRLYASTREEELKLTDWDEEERQRFVRMQFAAQQCAYNSYPNAAFFLLLLDGEPIGRVYLQDRETTLSIVDLSLLPAWRGQGIGGDVLKEVFSRAGVRQQAVRIHVEKLNPALRLYQRLGFRLLEDKGVYLLLERGGGRA